MKIIEVKQHATVQRIPYSVLAVTDEQPYEIYPNDLSWAPDMNGPNIKQLSDLKRVTDMISGLAVNYDDYTIINDFLYRCRSAEKIAARWGGSVKYTLYDADVTLVFCVIEVQP